MATAAYPLPPPYYKLYKDFSTELSSASKPPPPVDDTYVCFGGNYTTDDVLPSLEEQGVPKRGKIFQERTVIAAPVGALADVLVERLSQYARRIEEELTSSAEFIVSSSKERSLIRQRREEVQRQVKDSLGILDGY